MHNHPQPPYLECNLPFVETQANPGSLEKVEVVPPLIVSESGRAAHGLHSNVLMTSSAITGDEGHVPFGRRTFRFLTWLWGVHGNKGEGRKARQIRKWHEGGNNTLASSSTSILCYLPIAAVHVSPILRRSFFFRENGASSGCRKELTASPPPPKIRAGNGHFMHKISTTLS